MTLQEKLDAFQRGTAVLHTPTYEIFSKLMGIFVEQGFRRLSDYCWVANCVNTCVDYKKNPRTSFESVQWYRKYYSNLIILEVTEEDFNSPMLSSETKAQDGKL